MLWPTVSTTLIVGYTLSSSLWSPFRDRLWGFGCVCARCGGIDFLLTFSTPINSIGFGSYSYPSKDCFPVITGLKCDKRSLHWRHSAITTAFQKWNGARVVVDYYLALRILPCLPSNHMVYLLMWFWRLSWSIFTTETVWVELPSMKTFNIYEQPSSFHLKITWASWWSLGHLRSKARCLWYMVNSYLKRLKASICK